MEYEIKDGIEPPPARGGKDARSVYPFGKMLVRQYFEITVNSPREEHLVRQTTARHSVNVKRFVTRKTTGGKIQIWRIE